MRLPTSRVRPTLLACTVMLCVLASATPLSLPAFAADVTRAAATASPYVWDEAWFADRYTNFLGVCNGVAVDASGRVYASSVERCRVAKYRIDGSRQLSWGKRGSALGDLVFPRDVAVDGDGNVYVADTVNDRVQKFSPKGEPLLVFGATGRGDGQLMGPRGVTIGREGSVWVTDLGNDRIQVFSAGGAFLKTIGESGSTPGRLDRPHGLGTDASDNVYVADTFNHRVQVFKPTGELLRVFGGPGTGPGKFDYPQDVAVGPGGTVYVADSGNRRVQWLTAEGDFKAEFGPPRPTGGYTDTNTGGIAVDRSGNVYVANASEDRVDRFTPRGAKVVLTKPVLLTKNPRASRSVEVSASSRPVHNSVNDRVYWELRKSGSSRVKIVKPDRRYYGGRWVYYKKALKLSAGSYSIRAVSPKDAEHAKTLSSYLRFTVRR